MPSQPPPSPGRHCPCMSGDWPQTPACWAGRAQPAPALSASPSEPAGDCPLPPPWPGLCVCVWKGGGGGGGRGGGGRCKHYYEHYYTSPSEGDTHLMGSVAHIYIQFYIILTSSPVSISSSDLSTYLVWSMPAPDDPLVCGLVGAGRYRFSSRSLFLAYMGFCCRQNSVRASR